MHRATTAPRRVSRRGFLRVTAGEAAATIGRAAPTLAAAGGPAVRVVPLPPAQRSAPASAGREDQAAMAPI
jgi:hypothetical protein